MLGAVWSVLLSADALLLAAEAADVEDAADVIGFFFGVIQFVVGLSSWKKFRNLF
jgi:hypothetical protein